MMGSMSIWHWLIVGVVVAILFGGSFKFSSMMEDIAKGLKVFRKEIEDDK